MRAHAELILLREIWFHILKNGRVMDPDTEWNHYGAEFEDYFDKKQYKINSAATVKLLQQIKVIGVDWQKTEVPEYECRSEFTDSFHPPKDVDTWSGTLYLNDGSSYFVAALRIDVSGLITRMSTIVGQNQISQQIENMFGDDL